MKHIVLILSCCLPAYAPLLLGLVRKLSASWMRAAHGARDKGHSTVTMDEVLVPRAYINTKRAVWANSFRVVQTIMGRPAKGQKPWLQKHSTKRVHVRRVCWTKTKNKIKKNEEKHTKCAAARMLECVPYENECLLLGVQRRRKRKTAAPGHAKYGTRINHVS